MELFVWIFVWICIGILVRRFGIPFFCIEYFFGMVVWFGCGPQWRKNLYRENVRF